MQELSEEHVDEEFDHMAAALQKPQAKRSSKRCADLVHFMLNDIYLLCSYEA
jgi:hypothetical protein